MEYDLRTSDGRDAAEANIKSYTTEKTMQIKSGQIVKLIPPDIKSSIDPGSHLYRMLLPTQLIVVEYTEGSAYNYVLLQTPTKQLVPMHWSKNALPPFTLLVSDDIDIRTNMPKQHAVPSKSDKHE